MLEFKKEVYWSLTEWPTQFQCLSIGGLSNYFAYEQSKCLTVFLMLYRPYDNVLEI